MPTRDMAKQEIPSPVISGTGPATRESTARHSSTAAVAADERASTSNRPCGERMGRVRDLMTLGGRASAGAVCPGWPPERCAPNRGRADVEHEQHPRLTLYNTAVMGTSAEKETRDEERRHTEETTRDTHKIKPGGGELSPAFIVHAPPLTLSVSVSGVYV